MKIIRYRDKNGNIGYAAQQDDGSALILTGDIYNSSQVTQKKADVAKLLAPVVPSSIICIGLNYRRHAEETGAKFPEQPIVFFKGINSLLNPDEAIQIPQFMRSDEVDYECELAVVIGKPCKNVSRAIALNYVLGYTCCNDVSARDWQIKRGGDEIPNPNSLNISTVLNGQMLQDWNTNDMIFEIPMLIEFLSGSSTLLPGTVILTGTPHGVGMAQKPPRWLRPGDHVSIVIEKIGTLTNSVVNEKI